MRRVLTQAMAVLLGVQAVSAAEPVVARTDWNGFQRQVTQRRLNNRTARISLTTGEEIKAVVLKTNQDGLVVEANRKTGPWNTSGGQAVVPKGVISIVKFTGKTGHGGMIGGLAGLAAGGAIAGAGASSQAGNCEGGACGIILLAIPAFGVAGYLIGRAVSAPAPTFVIEH